MRVDPFAFLKCARVVNGGQMAGQKEQTKKFQGETRETAVAHAKGWVDDLTRHDRLRIVSIEAHQLGAKWVATVTFHHE